MPGPLPKTGANPWLSCGVKHGAENTDTAGAERDRIASQTEGDGTLFGVEKNRLLYRTGGKSFRFGNDQDGVSSGCGGAVKHLRVLWRSFSTGNYKEK